MSLTKWKAPIDLPNTDPTTETVPWKYINNTGAVPQCKVTETMSPIPILITIDIMNVRYHAYGLLYN